MKAAGNSKQKPTKEVALLGIGLDAEDGHTRITRGNEFVLFGGSQDTHSVMQETVIKVTEKLDKRGKRLAEVTVQELQDIFRSVTE